MATVAKAPAPTTAMGSSSSRELKTGASSREEVEAVEEEAAEEEVAAAAEGAFPLKELPPLNELPPLKEPPLSSKVGKEKRIRFPCLKAFDRERLLVRIIGYSLV